jgi:hypothetical protein
MWLHDGTSPSTVTTWLTGSATLNEEDLAKISRNRAIASEFLSALQSRSLTRGLAVRWFTATHGR